MVVPELYIINSHQALTDHIGPSTEVISVEHRKTRTNWQCTVAFCTILCVDMTFYDKTFGFFAEKTSMHGVKNVYEARGRPCRCIWASITLCLTVLSFNYGECRYKDLTAMSSVYGFYLARVVRNTWDSNCLGRYVCVYAWTWKKLVRHHKIVNITFPVTAGIGFCHWPSFARFRQTSMSTTDTQTSISRSIATPAVLWSSTMHPARATIFPILVGTLPISLDVL